MKHRDQLQKNSRIRELGAPRGGAASCVPPRWGIWDKSSRIGTNPAPEPRPLLFGFSPVLVLPGPARPAGREIPGSQIPPQDPKSRPGIPNFPRSPSRHPAWIRCPAGAPPAPGSSPICPRASPPGSWSGAAPAGPWGQGKVGKVGKMWGKGGEM